MSAKNINEPDFENETSDIADASYDETYQDDAVYTEDDSDEWSDDVDVTDEEGEENEEPAPQKKKSSNLTIAIILVVAVIGVFGFMFLKGNNASAPQTAPQEQPVAINADAESDQASVTVDPATTPENAGTSINDLKNQADQEAQGDQTVNIKAPTAAQPAEPQQGLMENPNLVASDTNSEVPSAPVMTPDQPPTLTAPADLSVPAAPSSQEVVKTISPTVKPVSDFPTVDSIKKPDADTVEQAPVPVVATTDTAVLPVPPQTPAQAAAQDDKTAKLQVQVKDAQEKIALLEKQLSNKSAELDAQKQIAAKAAAAPAVTSGASDAEVDALRGRIADLEERLAAKTEKPAKAIVPERKVVEEDSYTADEPIIKKPVASTKPQAVMKQSWALKSAGPGKATLSDKATGDLKTVRVGDVVSGLGRIVSISDTHSAWVVKGTLGSVSE